MFVTLDHTEDIANNIKTFWFKPDQPMDYVAGQFIEMSLPHRNPDERGQKHWFTLSSSPSEKLISITTKHAEEQVSSFKRTLFKLKSGDKVKISESMGDFVLPKNKTIPLIFVAGGIGITPMRSMVKWLTDTSEHRNIHMLYAVHSENEIAFENLFEDYGIQVHKIFSGLTSKNILDFANNDNQPFIYISGPEELVEKLESELLSAGVDNHRLVLDFFPGYKSF